MSNQTLTENHTMMSHQHIMKITLSGALIAIGIIIPMFSPVKILIEPASFTLASHVVIFVAMFLSPAMAVAVSLGTTFGFFLGGFPPIVVLRALTHVGFALVGSLYLHKIAKQPLSPVRLRIFSFCMALLHSLGELAVVTFFYFGGNINAAYLEQGFMRSVLLLVGIGTVVHSMIDFEIAHLVILPLKKSKSFATYLKNC